MHLGGVVFGIAYSLAVATHIYYLGQDRRTDDFEGFGFVPFVHLLGLADSCRDCAGELVVLVSLFSTLMEVAAVVAMGVGARRLGPEDARVRGRVRFDGTRLEVAF